MLDEIDILLVEDNLTDAEFTVRTLSSKHTVRLVHDGAEAVDFLFGTGEHADRDVRVQPKLILLDLKLPKMNGLEVLRRLKTDPRTAALPVVVFTSSNQPRDIEEGYRLGANSYVVKPVNFEHFTAAVRMIGTYWLDLNAVGANPMVSNYSEESRDRHTVASADP
jgi:two-component system response regulator